MSEPNATRREWIGLAVLVLPTLPPARLAVIAPAVFSAITLRRPGPSASTGDTARSTPTVLSN